MVDKSETLWGVPPTAVEGGCIRIARLRRCSQPLRASEAATRAAVVPVSPPLETPHAGDGASQREDSWRHTPALEQEHVVNVYETIAAHWDQTRHTPWPRVVDFLLQLPGHALVADVGCGNGKYLGVAHGHAHLLGSDRCVNLVDICREQGYEVAVCDNMTLPYRDNIFDAALSVAVLHHFSTIARRRRAVLELARIVRPGGRLLIQAWAREQVSVDGYEELPGIVLLCKTLNQISNTRGLSHDGNFQLRMCLCRGTITPQQTWRKSIAERRNMARLRPTKATLSFTDGMTCLHSGAVVARGPNFVRGKINPY